MDMKDVVKILFLRLFEQEFSKEVIFSIVLTENTRRTAERRAMVKISCSQNEWRSDFWLLRLLFVQKLKL